MAYQTRKLGGGVRFDWTTSDSSVLEVLHKLVVQTLEQGVNLTGLREIANLGRIQMALGGPPFQSSSDVPFPDSLKQISSYVKRII
jgi:hypothetical protein